MTAPDFSSWPLIVVGLLLLSGYAAHVVGQRTRVPRVTLLLLLGVLAGPHVFALVPAALGEWFPLASEIALSMVGFLLGERFLRKQLHKSGRVVVAITIAESVCAALTVLGVLLLIGTPPPLALLLAGIAPASAPAATVDVINESGAEGPLTSTVLAVVAIDDALGIVLFSVFLVTAQAITGDGLSGSVLLAVMWEIGGGVLLGAALGLPMSWVTGRARPGELTLIETLGFVLLCGGLAVMCRVSYLLACITLGVVVANRAHHHSRPFHAIKGISQPFMILFFILAGLEFDWRQFATLGVTGAAYVLARSAGLIAGGSLGATIGNAEGPVRKYVGWCLLPQAGVALGLGLVAAQRFPEYGTGVLSLLLGTTFAFEVFGPIATKVFLGKAGETLSARGAADRGKSHR
jgi:Kef-type K+ transport system membrane component KefB